MAISMMRLPAAVDFLLDLIASESEATALTAMSALKFHAYDPKLCERLALAVRKTGNRVLESRLNREFPANQ